MADFIISQLSVQVPVGTSEEKTKHDSGVSVERWKETSGTPLMYNGQGKYDGERPNDWTGRQVESNMTGRRGEDGVGDRSQSGAEQPLQEPTTRAKPLEHKEPPAAPQSLSSTAGPRPPSIAAVDELQPLGSSQAQHRPHETADSRPRSIVAYDVSRLLGRSQAQPTLPTLTKRQKKRQRQQTNRGMRITHDERERGEAGSEAARDTDMVGLNPPILESGARVNGLNKRHLRRENKQR